MSSKAYLAPNEVADLLMVSPVTVRQWAQKGMLDAMSTAGGHRRFTMEEVERFAKERGLTLFRPENEAPRILIVDDNADFVSTLKDVINSINDEIKVETIEKLINLKSKTLSIGFGDSMGDVPMLEVLDHAFIYHTDNHPKMIKLTKQKNWVLFQNEQQILEHLEEIV